MALPLETLRWWLELGGRMYRIPKAYTTSYNVVDQWRVPVGTGVRGLVSSTNACGMFHVYRASARPRSSHARSQSLATLDTCSTPDLGSHRSVTGSCMLNAVKAAGVHARALAQASHCTGVSDPSHLALARETEWRDTRLTRFHSWILKACSAGTSSCLAQQHAAPLGTMSAWIWALRSCVALRTTFCAFVACGCTETQPCAP